VQTGHFTIFISNNAEYAGDLKKKEKGSDKPRVVCHFYFFYGRCSLTFFLLNL